MTDKGVLRIVLASSMLVLLSVASTVADGTLWRDDDSRRGRRCSLVDMCGRLATLEQAVVDGFAAVDQDTTAIAAQLDALLQPAAWVVQAVATQGAASPGNADPANLLVVVTDARTGAAVTRLTQPSFSIVAHEGPPGGCGFTNQIQSFVNAGTGAYRIHIAMPPAVPGCAWMDAEYMGQVRLARGQAVFKLAVH